MQQAALAFGSTSRIADFLAVELPILLMLSSAAGLEYLIIVTSIKSIRAGRIAKNFDRAKQVSNSRAGCRRGGYRHGAGKKKGCGRWGEETVIMRVSKSQIEKVKTFLESSRSIEMIKLQFPQI